MKRTKTSLMVCGAIMLTMASCGKKKDSSSPSIVITGSNVASANFTKSLSLTTGSPTSIKMKFYGLAVSLNADCSDPQLVFDIENAPQEFDMVGGPTLFSGTLASGTYNCVIMKVSDNVKYRVNQAAVTAHAGCVNTTTEYTHDIYRTDNGGSVWNDMEGNLITATGAMGSPGEDIVEIAATTDTTAAVANGWHADQVLDLSAGMVVPGSLTFFADFNNGIDNSNSGGQDYCVLENGGFGFR